jgi:hypothetical protein
MTSLDRTGADLGLADRDGLSLAGSRVLGVRQSAPGGAVYAVALLQALQAEGLTAFLNAVAPHGCPVAGYLVRAYALPDFPYPTVLKNEHAVAPDGLGEAYQEFDRVARRAWIAALEGAGPGLTPALAWTAGAASRFLSEDELAALFAAEAVELPGRPDGYLGRGLALLANPEVAAEWPGMLSLGGVTKIRPITGREYPLWVALPAHQPALLQAPLRATVERWFA